MAIDKHMRCPLHRYVGPLETFKYMVNQQSHFVIDLEQRDEVGFGILGHICLHATFINEAHGHGFHLMRYLYGTGQLQPSWKHTWWIFIALLYVASDSTSDSTLSIPKRFGIIDLPKWLADLVPASDWHLRYSKLPVIIACDYHPHQSSAFHRDKDKRPLIRLWLAMLQVAGINLHDYFQDVDDIFDENTVLDTSYWRQGIKGVFTVEYGSDPDDVTILVQDVQVEIRPEDCIPGAWTADKTLFNTGLVVKGLKPTADWRVSSKEESVMSMVRCNTG